MSDLNSKELEKISASRSDRLSQLEKLVRQAKKEQKAIESEKEKRGTVYHSQTNTKTNCE